MSKILAITQSSTGTAHTHMAAEALRKTAQSLGHDLQVATLDSDDASPDPSDIANADVVIVGADRFLDRDRFSGKPIYAGLHQRGHSQ